MNPIITPLKNPNVLPKKPYQNALKKMAKPAMPKTNMLRSLPKEQLLNSMHA